MRNNTRKPIEHMEIDRANFDEKSRDDIPQLIRGLQYIFLDAVLREAIFKILESIFPKDLDLQNGRPGMDLWSLFVMAVIRTNLNCDYDRLHNLVNNHKTLRQILGHGLVDDQEDYCLQTLKDNVRLLTPEALAQIDQLIIQAGHQALKKNALDVAEPSDKPGAFEDKLQGRCDSFVVETNVEYPTDTGLLFDALRKIITLLEKLGRRQSVEIGFPPDALPRLKKLWRRIQKLKPSTSKDQSKQEKRQQEIREAYQAYLDLARKLLDHVAHPLAALEKKCGAQHGKILKIKDFMNHACRQIDQIDRRALQGQKIPHQEKVFSLFEPHTQWLNKGKAGVLVELGLAVGIVEDQYGFILHHQVMEQDVDVDIAVQIIKETQGRFPQLSACSFDQGFHSPTNQRELSGLLETVILPRKGRLSAADQERQQQPIFIEGRRRHPGVESAIHALEVHGLDRCPDSGLPAFKRYVALAIVGRNIQVLGRHLQRQQEEREKEEQEKKERCRKSA